MKSSPVGRGRMSKAAPVEPTPRPRRADVRRRILDSARSVFAELGFVNASLDQVAAFAGFTKGAVYSNFSTKEELFMALMDESILARVDVAKDALRDRPAGSNPAQVLGDRLTRALESDRDWQLLFLEFWMRAVRDPAVGERFVHYRNQFIDVVAQAITEVLDEKERGSLDARSMAVTVLALSNGFAIEYLADQSNVPNDLMGVVLSRVMTDV
nr:TetR/AcrR family transcriptional regulator [Rhodococcus sp. (in: high G+C Gram-positive bacteria)]